MPEEIRTHKQAFFVGKKGEKTEFFPDYNELVNFYLESDDIMNQLYLFASELKKEVHTTASIEELIFDNVDEWMEEALNECGYTIYKRSIEIG